MPIRTTARCLALSLLLLSPFAGCGGGGSAGNASPSAEAGANQTVAVGTGVSLDGSRSSDPDGDTLAFQWAFVSLPAGSGAVLSTPAAATAAFTPDAEGDYVLRLAVADGRGGVASDTVTVSVGPLFAPAAATPTGSLPEAVAIGDLNRDGRDDVVMTTSYGSDAANDYKLFVFLQGADGRLLPPVAYPTRGSYANRPKTVAIGDVSGDGRNEVVVGLSGAGIEVFPVDDSGAPGPSVLYPTADSDKIRIADLNHDGRMDVAGIGWGTGSVSVLFQGPSGQLAAPVSYAVTHGGYDDLETGDVNSDGLADLVVMSGQGLVPNVGVLRQMAGGGFSAPAYASVGGQVSSSTLARGVAVGDVTGDGRADVIVSYGGNVPRCGLGIFAQDGAGALLPSVTLPTRDIPEAVEAADVNGDGRKDILVLHGGWQALGVHLQKPDGTIAPELLYRIPYASHYNPHGLAVGDIDGDGKPDVVLADANNGLVVLHGAR